MFKVSLSVECGAFNSNVERALVNDASVNSLGEAEKTKRKVKDGYINWINLG